MSMFLDFIQYLIKETNQDLTQYAAMTLKHSSTTRDFEIWQMAVLTDVAHLYHATEMLNAKRAMREITFIQASMQHSATKMDNRKRLRADIKACQQKLSQVPFNVL